MSVKRIASITIIAVNLCGLLVPATYGYTYQGNVEITDEDEFPGIQSIRDIIDWIISFIKFLRGKESLTLSKCEEMERRFGEANPPQLIEETKDYIVIKFERDKISSFLYSECRSEFCDGEVTFTNCNTDGIRIDNYVTIQTIEQETGTGYYWQKKSDGSIYATCLTWNQAIPNPESDPNAILKIYSRAVAYYKYPAKTGEICLKCFNPDVTYIYNYEGLASIEDVSIYDISQDSAYISFYTTEEVEVCKIYVGRKVLSDFDWFKVFSPEKNGRAFDGIVTELNSGTTYYLKIFLDDVEVTVLTFKTLEEPDEDDNERDREEVSIFSYIQGLIIMAVVIYVLWRIVKRMRKGKKKINLNWGKKR